MQDPASTSSGSVKSRWLVVALAAATFLLTTTPALGKRVVLTKFTGPQAAKAQKAVAAVIKRDHTVVATSKFKKAKKKLKIKKLNPRNIQKLAEELNVDAIVSGKMQRKGGRFQLVVTVREAKSGDIIDKHTIKLRGPKIDETAKGDIAEEVLPTIAAVESVSEDSGEVASAGKTTGKGKRATEEEEGGDEGGDEAGDEGGDEAGDEGGDEEPADPKEKQVAMADESGGGEDKETPEAEVEEAASADSGGAPEDEDRYARDAAADVALGVSFIGRNMSFTYDSAAVTSMPWGYRGNPVPGAYVVGEVYPLAFSGAKGALSGIGIGFNFDRIITLRSRLMSGGEEYDTTQQRYGVGALYRWNIGDKPTGPTVKFALGYNGLAFKIDTGSTAREMVDLPDVGYKFIDVGAGIRLPLGSPRIAVSLDAKYLQILGTGAMQTMANYGGASVTGLDADAAFEFRPVTRLVVRVGGRYTRIGYSFDGSGAKTTMRDADPASKDVGGALDQYFGGYVLGGYLF